MGGIKLYADALRFAKSARAQNGNSAAVFCFTTLFLLALLQTKRASIQAAP
jgi:hypothetical protein